MGVHTGLKDQADAASGKEVLDGTGLKTQYLLRREAGMGTGDVHLVS